MQPPDSQYTADIGVVTGSLMDTIALLVLVLWGGFTSGLRRLARGPRHPGWSLAFDVFVGMQRASYAQLSWLGPVRFRRASDRLSPLHTGGVPFREVGGSVPGHWVEPTDAGDRVMLYFHGGGYIFGSFRTHGTLIGALARSARARTFVPSYRLAPEHALPAATEDGCAAFATLLSILAPWITSSESGLMRSTKFVSLPAPGRSSVKSRS